MHWKKGHNYSHHSENTLQCERCDYICLNNSSLIRNKRTLQEHYRQQWRDHRIGPSFENIFICCFVLPSGILSSASFPERFDHHIFLFGDQNALSCGNKISDNTYFLHPAKTVSSATLNKAKLSIHCLILLAVSIVVKLPHQASKSVWQPPLSSDELKQWVDFPDAAEKRSQKMNQESKTFGVNFLPPKSQHFKQRHNFEWGINHWCYCQVWRQRLHKNGGTTSAEPLYSWESTKYWTNFRSNMPKLWLYTALASPWILNTQ